MFPPPFFSRKLLAETSGLFHGPRRWKRRTAAPGEVSFAEGLRTEHTFPDQSGLLETAYADFANFLASINLKPRSARLRFIHDSSLAPEEHVVQVRPGDIAIVSADTEGVRRALVWIEDEMLRRGGPFLSIGPHRRRPVITTRLSRCFMVLFSARRTTVTS